MNEREKKEIQRRYLIISLVILACAIAYLFYSALVAKAFSPLYRVVMIAALAAVWILTDVVSPLSSKEFEDKTPAQMDAYKKMAALELVGYIGLAVFALAVNTRTGTWGAIVFALTVMYKRKFRDEYLKPSEPVPASCEQGDNGELTRQDSGARQTAGPADSRTAAKTDTADAKGDAASASGPQAMNAANRLARLNALAQSAPDPFPEEEAGEAQQEDSDEHRESTAHPEEASAPSQTEKKVEPGNKAE